MDSLAHQLLRQWDRVQIRCNRAIMRRTAGPEFQRLITGGPADMFNVIFGLQDSVMGQLREVPSQLKELSGLQGRLAKRLMIVSQEFGAPLMRIFPPDFLNLLAQASILKNALVISRWTDEVRLTKQGEKPS